MPDPTNAIDPLIASSPGNVRVVLEAAAQALCEETASTLVIVMETEGSTYAKTGAMAFFGSDGQQVGWLSGGCLEPEIARCADAVATSGRYDAMDIDTRDDEDLFSGSSVGCRGRLRLLLLPLQPITGVEQAIAAWREGGTAFRVQMRDDGALLIDAGVIAMQWNLQRVIADAAPVSASGTIAIAPPPAVLIFGAGPETPMLIAQLRALGWRVRLCEQRARWKAQLALADIGIELMPEQALAGVNAQHVDAALVMHHNFELDRRTLHALAATDIAFIGLLGPRRRRDDLFKLLSASTREALTPRLHAPVGLDLGGFGAEAIALSIAAQLHAWRHGR